MPIHVMKLIFLIQMTIELNHKNYRWKVIQITRVLIAHRNLSLRAMTVIKMGILMMKLILSLLSNKIIQLEVEVKEEVS